MLVGAQHGASQAVVIATITRMDGLLLGAICAIVIREFRLSQRFVRRLPRMALTGLAAHLLFGMISGKLRALYTNNRSPPGGNLLFPARFSFRWRPRALRDAFKPFCAVAVSLKWGVCTDYTFITCRSFIAETDLVAIYAPGALRNLLLVRLRCLPIDDGNVLSDRKNQLSVFRKILPELEGSI